MTVQPPDLRTLDAAVGARIKADAKLERAKASFWRFAGYGLFAALLGAGVGAAFFGYSTMNDNRAAATKVADAMARALERAQLSMTGEVRLADNQTITLKPGSEVALAPGGVVKVDPSSTITMARPPFAFERPEASVGAEPRAAGAAEYTTFRTSPFGAGSVVTAWSFANAEQHAPLLQYCYYSVQSENGVLTRVDIGRNGGFLPSVKAPSGLDLQKAFAACRWFAG